MNTMDGIDLISKERMEQKVIHGFTTSKDAEYKNNELIFLTMYCLMSDKDAEKDNLESYLFYDENGPKFSNELLLKLKDKSKYSKLIVAGALIAAQLDSMIYKINQGPDENLPK